MSAFPQQKQAQKGNFIDQLARSLSWEKFLFAVGIFFFLSMILFPFYWMVSSSFKSGVEIAGRAPFTFLLL
jgi:ABC-type glycerol-3-phosphate transport system permease component